MIYMGSKARIAKEILPIILKDRGDAPYVEPFCGGCNSLCLVTGERYGYDINWYLIAMWRGLQFGREYPQEITRELYNKARNQLWSSFTDEYFTMDMVGWVGFMGSFNGRFFHGYSGETEGRNYPQEHIRNTMKQVPLLKDVTFRQGHYRVMDYPENSIIYCDPPYRGTKAYDVGNFRHDTFWKWCREMTLKGHKVFISECNAPEDFECVWEKEITNSMHPENTYKRVEKLFIYKI